MTDDLLGDRFGDESPWRRDADADFERVEPTAFRVRPDASVAEASGLAPEPDIAVTPTSMSESIGSSAVDAARTSSGRRPGRSGALAAAAVISAVLVAVIGVIAVDVDGPTGTIAAPAIPDTVAAPLVSAAAVAPIPVTAPCVERRLPEALVTLWAVGVDGDVVGDLIAGVGHLAMITAEPGAARLTLLDTADGVEAWSAEVALDTRLVGIAGGVVLSATLSNGPLGSTYEVTARHVADGRPAWTRRLSAGATFDFRPTQEVLVVDDPAAGPDDVGFTSVIEVASGSIETSNVGRLLALDEGGRLVTLAGDKVLATSAVPSSDSVLGVRETGAPVAVLGSVVLSAPDGPGALVRSRWESPMGVRTDEVELVPPPGFDELGIVAALTAVGDEAVVIASNGFLVGAELVDDRVEGRWFVEGVLLGEAANDRGRSLLVSSDGGATQSLLDAATGEEVVNTVTTNGGVGVDDLYPNGSLVRGGVGAAPTLTAYDLDGDVMWRLGPPADITIGNGTGFAWFRQVGTATNPPSISIGVQAFGEATAPCATADIGEASSR